MRHEWMNDRKPLPAGHRKAGQIGVTIDFEDGRPEPQNVYAADETAMLDKLLAMYGNTQVRNGELKRSAQAPAAAAPAPPPAMTPDELMQTVADLDDPAKAPGALTRLIQHETGVDLKAQARAGDAQRVADAEIARLKGEADAFIAANPDYHPSNRNAMLLRDRALAIAQTGLVTAEHFQEAYEQLQEMDVLESAPALETPPVATKPPEPSAPPAARPRTSTGMRPSAFRGAGQVPTGPQMTRSDVEAIAGTDDYAHRLKHEPGFMEQVEAALARG